MTGLDNKLLKVINKYKGHPEFLGIEISDPNQPGAVDDTLLHLAARKGDIESIQVLLDYGAEIDVIGDLGNTPLHQAAMSGQIESVKMLLQYGANKKIRNEYNQTASDVAEIGKHYEIANLISD